MISTDYKIYANFRNIKIKKEYILESNMVYGISIQNTTTSKNIHIRLPPMDNLGFIPSRYVLRCWLLPSELEYEMSC